MRRAPLATVLAVTFSAKQGAASVIVEAVSTPVIGEPAVRMRMWSIVRWVCGRDGNITPQWRWVRAIGFWCVSRFHGHHM